MLPEAGVFGTLHGKPDDLVGRLHCQYFQQTFLHIAELLQRILVGLLRVLVQRKDSLQLALPLCLRQARGDSQPPLFWLHLITWILSHAHKVSQRP